MPGRLIELVGAIHIHSDFSDGTQSIPEIAEIAAQAGLDFIMVSDHMTLEPLKQGLEGFYGKTAALIGYEINDPDDKNHYLAYDLDEIVEPGLQAADYVRLVRQKGGLGIIAHPDEIRNRLAKYPSYPWTAWDVSGFDGIEIWNHMSQWMESLSRWNMLKQAVTPRRSLKSPTPEILKRWDDLNQDGRVVGVGSIDVHAYPYRLGPLRITIFPYKVQFRAIRTHILIPANAPRDFASLKKAIYDSLRKCRVFISNYRWGDAAGFEFYAENDSGRAFCGEELVGENDSALCINLPGQAFTRLMCNGREIFAGTGREFKIKASSGLYRVEVYVHDKGWVFSNHLRIIKKRG